MTIRRILSCALLAALCLPASAEPGELFPDAKGTKPSPSTPGKSAPAFPATPKLTGAQAAAAAAQARKMVQDFSAKAKLRIQETASDRLCLDPLLTSNDHQVVGQNPQELLKAARLW